MNKIPSERTHKGLNNIHYLKKLINFFLSYDKNRLVAGPINSKENVYTTGNNQKFQKVCWVNCYTTF